MMEMKDMHAGEKSEIMKQNKEQCKILCYTHSIKINEKK